MWQIVKTLGFDLLTKVKRHHLISNLDIDFHLLKVISIYKEEVL